MACSKKPHQKKNSNGANLGFEEKLWQAADKMRATVNSDVAMPRPAPTFGATCSSLGEPVDSSEREVRDQLNR